MKLSAGWEPLFRAHKNGWDFPIEIVSVDDYKKLFNEVPGIIVDEYNHPWTEEELFATIEQRKENCWGLKKHTHPNLEVFYDLQGNAFTYLQFS